MKDDYKGFVIVPGASWSTELPYTANYSIFKPIKPGAPELTLIHHGYAPGVFQTQDETWAAAQAAARAYIDTL